MKKIFLHIGCGKTGSSALQLWLNNNADALKGVGIDYPLFGKGKLDDYTITSGNGLHVMNAHAKGELCELLENLASESKGDILISSEAFQSLSDLDLHGIKELIDRIGLDPVIIAYVRDVYDMIYSSYLQLVKRHLYTRTFKEFALSRQEMQQFKVVRNWDAVFSDVRIVHYDSERESLDRGFCRALGIDPEQVPRMPSMKVNRSLMLEEAELLRLINQVYVSRFANPDQALSRIISDAFIMEDPEAETPILIDDDVIRHVGVAFKEDIEWINKRFFDGRPVMAVFNPEGKQIATEVPALSKATTSAIRALMSSISSFEFAGGHSAAKKPDRQERLDIADPRIVDALRDEALRREHDSLSDALTLMGAAKTLRPNGPLITKKVEEYQTKLIAGEDSRRNQGVA